MNQGQGKRHSARIPAHIGTRAGLVEVKRCIRGAIGIESSAFEVECPIANSSTFQRGEQWLLPLGVLEEDNKIVIHARLITINLPRRGMVPSHRGRHSSRNVRRSDGHPPSGRPDCHAAARNEEPHLPPLAYQTRHGAARTMGCPARHAKAVPNSGMLETTPLMRNSSGEWGLVMAFIRLFSERSSPQAHCAIPTKKR